MFDHYYGLSAGSRLTPEVHPLPFNQAPIDCEVLGATVEIPDATQAFTKLALGNVYITIGGATIAYDEAIPLHDAKITTKVEGAPVALGEGIQWSEAGVDLTVLGASLSLEVGMQLSIAQVELEVGGATVDNPLINTTPLTMNVSSVDLRVDSAPVDNPLPAALPLGLNDATVELSVGGASIDNPDIDTQPVNLNVCSIDLEVRAAAIDNPLPQALPLPLSVASIDLQVEGATIDNPTPLAEPITMSVASVDMTVGAATVENPEPDAIPMTFSVASVDMTIGAAPIDNPELPTVPMIFHEASVDLTVLSASVTNPLPQSEPIIFSPASVDLTVLSAPVEQDPPEAATFGGQGLLKGPTSNYATNESTGTLMFWLNVPIDVAEDRRITFAANAGSTPRIQFFVQADIAGTQTIGVETDDGIITQTWFFEPDQNIFDGNKHWVVIRGNGSSYEVFIDGVPATGFEGGVNTGKWFDIQQTAGTNFDTLQIGGFDEGTNVELFYGILDEVVHLGTPLSNAQILDLWNSGDGATVPEMIAATWWSQVNAAYEMAKDQTRNWGDDYLGVNDLIEDPAGFLEPGGSLVNGGWTP